MHPEAILLDLGGVLVGFDHTQTCRALAEKCTKSPEDLYQEIFGSGLEARYDRGQVSTERFLENVAKVVQEPALSLEDIHTAWTQIFHRLEENLALLPRLKHLAPVYLLSNTNAAHFDAIWKLVPELEGLSGGILSFVEGAIKPEPKIYQAAIQRLGVAPEKILFVDDNPGNVLAAKNLGIQGFELWPEETLESTLAQAGVALPTPAKVQTF